MIEWKIPYKLGEKLRTGLEDLRLANQISEPCREYDIKPARSYHWEGAA